MLLLVVSTCSLNTEFDIFAGAETLKPFMIVTFDVKYFFVKLVVIFSALGFCGY